MDRAVAGSLAIVAASAALLGITFWVALEPVATGSCNTSLLPGAYTDALVPLHLAVAAALGACALWLDRGRLTITVLAAVGVYVLASLLVHGLFMPAAVVGVVLGWPAAILAPFAAALRWKQPRQAALIVVWAALLVVLPGHFVAAWSEGASWFCF